MYKEAYLYKSNHSCSLPSIVISILQDPKDDATHIAMTNNRATKLDLRGKFNASPIFNVPDLFSFDVDDNSRTIFPMNEGMMGTIVQEIQLIGL